MEGRTRYGMALGLALTAGLAAALFLAGPALFADGSLEERLTVVAILVVILLLTGIGVGYLAPKARTITPWFLAVPTVLVSIFFSLDESGVLQVGIPLMGGSIGAAIAGVLLGGRLRLGRSPPANAP